MKTTLKFIALASFVALTSIGCSTIYFHNGNRGNTYTDINEWHHDGIFGLVEFSDPVDMAARCGSRSWETIRVEETFVQGLVGMITYRLYDPWDVSWPNAR